MAETFQQRRAALGMASHHVAWLLGVVPAVYSRWETGREQVPPKRRAQLEMLLGKFERTQLEVRRELDRVV
jgi:DNA-binding transcriptional regulator YdaS (Cro superfamily)